MGKFRPGKAGSWQYKWGIPPCRNETFCMHSQDIINEEFITLSGFRQNEKEFHPGEPGSCNYHLDIRWLENITLSNTYQIFCNIHLERYIITFLINQINHVFLGILRLTIAHIFKDWSIDEIASHSPSSPTLQLLSFRI